jgi:hypothetical protein
MIAPNARLRTTLGAIPGQGTINQDEQLEQAVIQSESWSENRTNICLTLEMGFFALSRLGKSATSWEAATACIGILLRA